MLQNRKITTSNAQAAKFRILNNIRMQRAGRFSMKKMAINNIIQKSNNQRFERKKTTNCRQDMLIVIFLSNNYQYKFH